jgi:hypothetical protein
MKPGQPLQTVLLMLPTAVLCLVLVLVGIHTRTAEARTQGLAAQARRVALAESMRVSLATASDAERSAVLAVTDEESQVFANQTREALAALDRSRAELEPLLESPERARARQELERFNRALEGFRKLDAEILSLAVRNTNLKAYGLAFGPAAQEVSAIDAALSRLMNQPQASKSEALAAARALASVLRIQSLLAPHIAEESDPKMDALEAQMSKEDEGVKRELAVLAGLPQLKANPDLAAAQQGYERHAGIRARILQLSRENTNVHSLSLTLDGNRLRAMSSCQDALAALRQEMVDEQPMLHPPVHPR